MRNLSGFRFALIISIVAIVISSCGTKKKIEESNTHSKPVEVAKSQGPSTIIYKTKDDYSNNIPVILSEDKKRIISYPAPKDVFFQGELAKPVCLDDGYLLDVRGISKNVAYTSYTYETYASLKTSPSIDSLMLKIIDDDPLEVMYNCGNRYKFTDPVTEINKLINDGTLGKCDKEK